MAGEATRDAARKRAAVELIARYESALRRTARRYSLSVEDAEDAFQRAMEILVTKAPTTDPGELIRWTQTVTKHEALAVRRSRERSAARLASPPRGAGEEIDWVSLIPAASDGPDGQAERREAAARSREALRALKPAERRALGLLASGCSYAEIGQITGFSATKVNRSIAEGRERFRRLLMRSEDGSRCEELQPLLSAFCDGEASTEETAILREHLRACGPCRATMRSYRATPGAVAALAPAPFGLAALLKWARDLVGNLGAQTKVAIVCAGTAGAGAACVAAGLVPAPLGTSGDQEPAAIERSALPPAKMSSQPRAGLGRRPAPEGQPAPKPAREEPEPAAPEAAGEAAPAEQAPPVEAPPAPPEPSPVPEPPPTPPPSQPSSGAAGEFGP